MAAKVRQIDVGTARVAELIRRISLEIRQARIDRGLSLATAGRAARLSTSEVSRIERGLVARVSIYDLARLHAVVGLELSMKSYPAGQPVRDAAQVALLDDFRRCLDRSIHWAIEVPCPSQATSGLDALLRGDGWRYGVEGETAPRDVQSVVRRLQLKVRDGRVDGVMLVLRHTVQSRRFVSEAGDSIRAAFPVDGVRALELLQAGVDPGGSALVVLPARTAAARRAAQRFATGATAVASRFTHDRD